MARCDRGYLCAVCGHEVENLTDSVLYLLYVLGEIPAEQLHRLPERHIRCEPSLAQYIDDAGFASVTCEGPFDRRTLDAEFATGEVQRVTAGWRRLQSIPGSGMTILDYPLSDSY